MTTLNNKQGQIPQTGRNHRINCNVVTSSYLSCEYMGFKVHKEMTTMSVRCINLMSLLPKTLQSCGPLTKTEKHQRHLSERCIWGREVEFSFGPSQSILVESGQYVVSAQGFGLGHQLLLSQRPVKHIQDLCSKHRGPPQDLHVLLQGKRARGCLTSLDQLCLSVSSTYPGGTSTVETIWQLWGKKNLI